MKDEWDERKSQADEPPQTAAVFPSSFILHPSSFPMAELLSRILHAVTARSYTPLKAKALFKRLNLGEEAYPEFRRTVRELVRTGRLALGRNQTLRVLD